MPESSAISQFELADIRRESVQFMPDQIKVHTVTRTRTASGGYTTALSATPARTVKGRLAEMDETLEQFYADRLGGRQGWTVTVPRGTTVPVSAVFKIGSRSFEILGSDTVRSYQITQRYACSELT